MICPHHGCGCEFPRPVRTHEQRGNHKPAWLCPACSGRLDRPSTTKGAKKK